MRKCLIRFSHVQLFATLWTVAWKTPLSMRFTKQDTRVCHALLQGIFLTQGSNPSLLYPPCIGRWILYH